jgi:biopolymer transport protein ExbD
MADVDSAGPRKHAGGRRHKKRTGVRIDMTPMVDVAFLLLVFFMVTTVFRAPQAMEVNLPPADQKVEVAESNLMILYVTADDSLFWGIGFAKPQGTTMQELPELLSRKNRENPALITLVKLDRKARYRMMVDLLDELNVANVTRFSVAALTDKDKEALAVR